MRLGKCFFGLLMVLQSPDEIGSHYFRESHWIGCFERKMTPSVLVNAYKLIVVLHFPNGVSIYLSLSFRLACELRTGSTQL